MRELATMVVTSFFFIFGVVLGGIIVQPNLLIEVYIVVGVAIAIGVVVLFVGLANLVIKALETQ